MNNIYIFILECFSKAYTFLKSAKTKLPVLFLVSLVVIFALYKHGKAEKIEKEAYRTSCSVMLDSLHKYKVCDSLNAIQVGELKLTLKEYKKYKAENEFLLNKLKTDRFTSSADLKLSRVDTFYMPLSEPIISESKDSIRHFAYSNKWTTLQGVLYSDSVQISVHNTEELIVAEGIELKKFLFIKLPPKIFGYKSRKIEVLSKNPNTTITDVEWVNFR